MADNAYTKLSLGGQLGVSAALAVLIGGLFWYFYWTDAVTEKSPAGMRIACTFLSIPRSRRGSVRDRERV